MTLIEHNAAIAAWSAELGDDLANLVDRKAAYESAATLFFVAVDNVSTSPEQVVYHYAPYTEAKADYETSRLAIHAKFKAIADHAVATTLDVPEE